MKVAILGGGFTGLTAAYYLVKKGHAVTIFEKEQVLGGLASGFKDDGWDWYLEKTYHHVFSNDVDILNFASEIEFNDFFFQSPETASLYNSRAIPLDTPQDFLRFPLLSLPLKIRAAMVLGFLKFSPFFSFYEKQTAEEFLRKTMGEEGWNVLWQELFRKKFGKYAGNIVMSFFWARIKKRTKNLGYVRGGFQTFIDDIARKDEEMGIKIRKGYEVGKIEKRGEKFILRFCHPERSEGSLTDVRKKMYKNISSHSREILHSVQNDNVGVEEFDSIISTLPTPVLVKVAENIFPENYLSRLRKIKYLSAATLILQSEIPLLEKTYWLNVCNPDIPIMGLVQHTNFIDKKYYGGKHILYVANYVDEDDKRLKMNKEEAVEFYLPYLKEINPKYEILNTKSYLFKAPYAQPIFDKEFVKNMPGFETPVKNFFIANLDMTYPYDRGTNYAVKLGKDVSALLDL